MFPKSTSALTLWPPCRAFAKQLRSLWRRADLSTKAASDFHFTSNWHPLQIARLSSLGASYLPLLGILRYGFLLRLSRIANGAPPWILLAMTGKCTVFGSKFSGLSRIRLNGGVQVAGMSWNPVPWNAFKKRSVRTVMKQVQFVQLVCVCALLVHWPHSELVRWCCARA